MKKYLTIYKILILVLVIMIVSVCVAYNIGISAPTKDSVEVTFEVPENSTYLSIATNLKEKGLIKSVNFYKVYIKIFKPSNLQKGTYVLNKNMNVKSIIDKLEGNDAVINTVKLAIPEGKHIDNVAESIASITNYKKEDLMNYWSSSEFIDKAINKYWFITDEVKNTKLRYSLEGYFFPATYDILKEATMEEITYKMLDKMDEVLSKYKTEITNSNYSVHKVLTLASIIEYEAVLDTDRSIISGVFHNRLDKNMLLQSCATVGYAINEWKLSYTNKDLQTDSPYNTYKYLGLPVGPGGLAGEKSIKAAILPEDNDYLYFLANVYNTEDKKTYYSKTYSEHQQKCLQHLGRSC